MGDYYGGQYLETRLGETKKGERLTVYAETHQQDYHVRMAVLGYEWRIALSSYRNEGLVEMRLYGSVAHEGLAPVMVDGAHLLSDDAYRFGVSVEKTLRYLTPAQLDEFNTALTTPGECDGALVDQAGLRGLVDGGSVLSVDVKEYPTP
jgi:hypothetical protein